MSATEMFETLGERCNQVLKSEGVGRTRSMSIDQFAEYATEQIAKAAAEKTVDVDAARKRIEHLRLSSEIAKSAFGREGVDSFDIPVFAENGMTPAVAARFKSIEDKLDSVAKGKAVHEDDDDEKAKKAKAKADEEKAKAAKAKGGAGKQEEEEEEEKAKKAKAKDDEEKDDEEKAKAAKAAKEKEEEEEKAKGKTSKSAAAAWPRDLAKSVKKSDEEKDLNDWGQDPWVDEQAAE